MSFNWDEKTILLLIEQYKENELLWNPEDPHYKCRVKRLQTIKAIASLFGPDLDTTEIERKLKNLTSHYYREYKKYEEWKKSGEDDDCDKKSKWYAYKHLEFLQNRMRLTMPHEQEKRASKKKRRIYTDVEVTSKKTQTPVRDEASIFGEYIVTKLRRMDPVAKLTVQHLIQNIVFQAEMGVYSHTPFAASTQRPPSCESNSEHGDYANSECDVTIVKSENE